ncbi:hypothetical protein Mgra_00008338 [Meloidogyne graminicola]|uniref:Nucleotide-diphospho-sugar transferase domain-containing protein n=1 Tax=Meloidogyne graminicola TaxID=189291 RepID=A0A8S9ZG45_9BILA|nr:hypothetical protein Mgra_00008338 [Meloidogyne graminicola]
MMRQLRFRFLHLAILIISICFYLKYRRVSNIQNFLNEQSKIIFNDQIQINEYKEQFRKYALNITLNFLCNVRQFPGVIEQIVAVVFDSYSHQVLKESFPEMGGVIFWNIPALEEKFTSGDGRYQLFQYFRSKLASLLTETTNQFWMVQADTIWKKNLFEIIDLESEEFIEATLIFDSEGSEGLLGSMIAGGYFFVRSSNSTKKFFETSADFLLDHFATDNNVMTRQCIQQDFGVNCAKIKYR